MQLLGQFGQFGKADGGRGRVREAHGGPYRAVHVTGMAPLVLDGDPLDALGGGALVGYARVSTDSQNLHRQLDALGTVRCVRVFVEKQSGKNADRPELAACLDYLRPGDTLVVLDLGRLGRNLQDLLALVAGLRRRGIGFRSLHESLDTTTPGGRLVFHVFAALAEFIRELIVQGTHEGLAAARARGVRLGRPPAMTPEQIRHARDLLTHPENTVSSIARLLGVSRATIYKYVPELGPDELPAGTGPIAAALPAGRADGEGTGDPLEIEYRPRRRDGLRPSTFLDDGRLPPTTR